MRLQSGMPVLRPIVREIVMRRVDVGIRIRADDKFARLVDKAAELSGQTRSSFIQSAALLEARRVIQTLWAEGDVTTIARVSPEIAKGSTP